MHYLSTCSGCSKTYPSDLESCPHCGNWIDPQPAALDVRDWGYDIETYPNVFTATFIHAHTGTEIQFEISDRRNDYEPLVKFLYGLKDTGARGVGFNNLGFDYPTLHKFLSNIQGDARAIYNYAMTLIRSDDKFGSMVWDSDQLFPQLDLFKIHHFDNMARATSLKALEIAMRSRNVRDLPFPVGTILTSDQIDVLLSYNAHDVRETLKFYVRSLEQIKFREQLTERYKRNFMNHNDTKIGKDYFIMELEAAGVQCYDRGPKGRVPRQTIRPQINLGDVVFPYVKFERPEFNRILDFFRTTTITQTKGTFADLSATIDGFQFDFGTGGIHGSVPSQIVRSDETHQIVDIDVSSYYPSLSIVNRVFPEHLSDKFCDVNEYFFNERIAKGKNSTEGKCYKLAMNGTYGDSNNVYSPFYDPQYTMTITINGQLLICMLAEQLMKIPGLSMVQVNTDGVTVNCPRHYIDHMRNVCRWWEQLTRLQLEEVFYNRMMIRDVNNYLAECSIFDYLVDGEWVRKVPNDKKPTDSRLVLGLAGGKLKRKGAYEYNTLWHQDPSALVVPKAAEAALVRGESVREFITKHRDPFDFMLRAKVPRGSRLMLRWPEWEVETELQHITRYFVARNGGSLVKVSPPTGEPGTWKRRAKITDEFYNAVMREIAGSLDNLDAMGGVPSKDGVMYEGTMYYFDAIGTPWDARIHTGNRSKHDTRELSICAGWRVMECADAGDFKWGDLDYEWYISEAEKLVQPLTGAVTPLQPATPGG